MLHPLAAGAWHMDERTSPSPHLPLAGRSNRRSASARRRFGWGDASATLLKNVVRDIVEIRNCVEVPEAQNSVAARLEKCGSFGIASSILRLGVLRSVKFNDNLRTMAREIRNVLSDRRLASKVKAVTFASAQCAPHQALGLRGRLSQSARASDGHCRVAIRSGGQSSNYPRSKWQLLVQLVRIETPTRPPSRGRAPEGDLPARGRWGGGLWSSAWLL